MRALIFTDIHLENKIKGFLKSQIICLGQIYDKEYKNVDAVIICGDITMKRSPDPSTLLGLKTLLDHFSDKEIYLLRGNHDSETKADDGITYLSLFESGNTKVIIHSQDFNNGLSFIPHYEDESVIKKDLARVPKNNFLFGHFGYNGCMDRGDIYTTKVTLGDFRNPTVLGHIHTFSQQRNVTVLGTQYTTHWREEPKNKYYGILDLKKNLWNLEVKEVTHGPRFLSVGEENLEDLISYINDPNYTTYLRVYTSKFMGQEVSLPLLSVESLEVVNRPIVSSDNLSSYKPETNISVLTSEIIDDYISKASVDIEKEDLLKGLDKIKKYNEN